MTPIPSAKSRLRHALLDLRKSMTPKQRQDWDRAIADQLHAILSGVPATVIGVYWPIRGEPDLRDLYAMLAAGGKQLALPSVIDKNRPLKFCKWMPGDALFKDGMGVMVPASLHEVQPELLLVPCVGFNAKRIRLGYGGGFYDRTLALPGRPVAIGVAYAASQTDFPAEPHDIALDRIVTECGTMPACE
jgi:5-formyltetrahydrofolate cyclo-ligase